MIADVSKNLYIKKNYLLNHITKKKWGKKCKTHKLAHTYA